MSKNSKTSGRDYKSEYQNYHSRPEQIKNRAARNAARAKMEKANGSKTIPHNVDVDHRNPIAKGGGNGKGNLRLRPRSANRSFKRTSTAGMK